MLDFWVTDICLGRIETLQRYSYFDRFLFVLIHVFLLFPLFLQILQLGGLGVDHHPPHLPHRHLPVVGVRVVVPLDRRQVGVEVEEGWRREAFLKTCPVKAWILTF